MSAVALEDILFRILQIEDCIFISKGFINEGENLSSFVCVTRALDHIQITRFQLYLCGNLYWWGSQMLLLMYTSFKYLDHLLVATTDWRQPVILVLTLNSSFKT